MRVEDARMTFIGERERLDGVKIFSRADECSSLVKLSRFMSIVLLDVSVAVKKGGYIKVSRVMS